MDIAYAIDGLVPAAKYGGSLADNSQDSFNKMRWEDERRKPSWNELLSYWNATGEDAINTKKFDQKIFFGRLIQEFPAERWFELSKLGAGWTMQQLIGYPNFAGLKSYADGLLADGTITEDDAKKINVCLLEQGINLTEW